MATPLKARLVICIGLATGLALGQTFTYPDCPNLAASDFQSTELAAGKGLQEPVAFDLQAEWNAAGDSVTQINIFFTERLGKVKFYNGATQTVTEAGTIPVLANTPLVCCGGADDNGLMGIAVDPDYRVNRWIYLWYSPAQSDPQINPRLRLSRFTINAQNKLDMASEKVLIDILTSKGEHRHAGGPMTFDAKGDLWVTLGQSGNDIDYPTPGSQWSADSGLNQEWGPSNTASLRGSIFRIHPDENATAQRKDRTGTYGPGYTVPAGNFGEYWAGQFQAQGKADLAAQYRDQAKVLPEVYIKGNRSPHSIAVHPTRPLLTWGEVNPGGGNDEINLVSHPVFGGMPYFFGDNIRISHPGGNKDPNAPTNTSNMNSGVTQLPPAMPGTLVGGSNMGNVAITGPFYAYNRSLRNRDKLPPHLDNHFFHLTFAGNAMWVNAVDTATAKITRTVQVGNSLMRTPLRSPLAARIGPDGALYVLNYDGYYTTKNPAVERIRYAGTCLLPIVPTSVTARQAEPGVRRSAQGLVVDGRHEFTLHDLEGRLLIRLQGEKGAEYSFAALRGRYRLQGGLAIARVKTERGVYTGKVMY
jgi:cytochrome c